MIIKLLPEQVAKYWDYIRLGILATPSPTSTMSGIRRLRAIVDDMIDVSLIDNNMLALNYQPVWLNHIFQLLQRDMISAFSARKQTLIIHPFDGINQILFADAERLYQSIHNLLSNSIKYTPDGGKITVGGRLLPDFVEVTVSDTGIGISPEDQELIFAKFGQTGNTSLHSSGKTKFKGGGPGLGLPIARGIIEAHGGAIFLRKRALACGTTMRVKNSLAIPCPYKVPSPC